MDSSLSRVWWALALRGLLGVLFGVAALLWPGATLAAIMLLFGLFAIAEGVFTLAALLAGVGFLPWWAQLLGALVSLTAGVVAITYPSLTAVALLYVVAAWALLRGVADIAAAVQWRRYLTNEWLLALAGVVSVVFGVLLFMRPQAGVLALLWLVGSAALLVGVMLLVLGFRLRRLGRELRERRERTRSYLPYG